MSYHMISYDHFKWFYGHMWSSNTWQVWSNMIVADGLASPVCLFALDSGVLSQDSWSIAQNARWIAKHTNWMRKVQIECISYLRQDVVKQASKTRQQDKSIGMLLVHEPTLSQRQPIRSLQSWFTRSLWFKGFLAISKEWSNLLCITSFIWSSRNS